MKGALPGKTPGKAVPGGAAGGSAGGRHGGAANRVKLLVYLHLVEGLKRVGGGGQETQGATEGLA